jgi:serine/threonine protein kinase
MEIAQRCDFNRNDRIDAYCVEKLLGEGAFGKVFKVKNGTNDVFALKLLKLWEVPSVIRQQLTDRFDMEFETGQISSSYLVHSVDHGFVKGNPYMVMEFCPNGDLLQWTGSNKKNDLAAIGRDVLFGLKDLHRRGKVHRDLKPENVLIKEDGTAVLTDFGLSGDRNKRMTERNIWGKPTQIFGTYAYMPPEQVRPEKDATVLPTTDIFSFGVMMFQLITGDLPFGKLNDENDLAEYIRNGREGRWSSARLKNYADGERLYGAIEGCLTANYRHRLQSADAVLEQMPRGVGNSYIPTGDSGDMHIMEVKNGVLLRVMQGEEHGKVYKLDSLLKHTKIITVGRRDSSVDNVVSLTEEQSRYISRKHCTLEPGDATGQWYIRDGQWDVHASSGWRKSLNGTFVNSTEVPAEGLPFSPGDIISIGDTKLRAEGY